MRKILLYIIMVALAICTYLSVSYAYYSATIGTRQNMTDTITISGCVYMTVETQINLSGDKAVAITDNRALTNTNYRSAFTIYNNCSTAQDVKIAFAPGSANTMPIEAIKYALYEQGATVPTTGQFLNVNKIKLYDTVISEALTLGAEVEYGYEIANAITLAANSSKAYYVNVWIDSAEGGLASNSTADKVVRLHLLAAEEGELGGPLLNDWLVNTAPKSGTSAVGNTPWILTSDHTNEWRYAGKNPDNYIQFNGELWRIIGVMPNMMYCTGTYGSSDECYYENWQSGPLVKIIRNQLISSSNLRWDYKQTGVGSSTTNGSNDWSDSQLMLMLNGTNYLKTAYGGNMQNRVGLHSSYTITSNVVKGNGYNFYNATYSYLDGNGTTVNIPSSATTSSYTATSGTLYKKIESSALNKIASVGWGLYGTNSYTTDAEGSPSAFYNKERNIDNTGSVYTNSSLPEMRPFLWFGKIGLMYPSDYGYATNGGTTYDRNTCLGYQMNGWDSGSYKTDCALNSYLLFQNITSTAPGTSGTTQWTLSPRSGFANLVFGVYSTGYVNDGYAYNANGVRPVLYLKVDTIITGGSGTWNDPYTIE